MQGVLDVLKTVQESIRSFRGALLVQMQSMGFWKGRQYRVYQRIASVGAGSIEFRFSCARDFLLTGQTLYCDDGRIEVQIFTGATPSGVWTPIATTNAKNRIGAAAAVVNLNIPEEGGTFADGTERELIMADSGSGQGIGLGNILLGDRGLPAGTYYFRATYPGVVSAFYSFEWEELDTVAGV